MRVYSKFPQYLIEGWLSRRGKKSNSKNSFRHFKGSYVHFDCYVSVDLVSPREPLIPTDNYFTPWLEAHMQREDWRRKERERELILFVISSFMDM